MDPLAPFGPATRDWFVGAFAAPTPVQVRGWERIAAGEHALLSAPTGSGKTLAAFLYCLDRSLRLSATEPATVRTLYVSPLKALAYDVERNLRAPLVGIRRSAERLGIPLRPVRVSVRTGDTPQSERRQLARDPGDILVTTPESLYLLLGTDARRALLGVETVIVDEIHALAPGKRGVHLMLSLERLCVLLGREVQRVGLSATQKPLDEVARFLGGDRTVAVVDASEPPRLDLVIEVPVEEMERPQGEKQYVPPPPQARAPRRRNRRDESDADRPTERRGAIASPAAPTTMPEVPGEEQRGIWPAIMPRLLELIRAHRSTIVFTNSRRLCERLAQRLNELAAEPTDNDDPLADGDDDRPRAPPPPPLVRAHHGSIARAQREEIEELLKAGLLRGIVATSSLELGIDMGAVDLVIQIESPGSVARGLQRIGRAGHHVGEVSRGRIFPKHRGDLLEAAVVARRMLDGDVEPIRAPRNTLDVLAQQIVAMCADEPWSLDKIARTVRRCHAFRELSQDVLVAVLDMLSGRYPSDEFADLRPRLVWDRTHDTLATRRDARLIALLSGGTIPDRGTYGVHLGHEGPRVGELDEEMVHESRAGQTFLLGASTWRIVEITRDRVIVVPAPGEPGKMPFWRGEGPGRPIEVGRALGAFVRALGDLDARDGAAWLMERYRLDALAARNLVRYVAEQKEATAALPTDRGIVIERFRDELGDWRVCIHSPFGARVHAPWALALEARLGRKAGAEIQTLWSDDGLVLRFAQNGDELDEALPGADVLCPDPEEIEELVIEELGRSAMFATHFRENAARALLLPRRRAGQRTPLWAQRLRSQQLMAAAQRHPGFPMILETYRECLHDVFDMASLTALLGQIRRREVRVTEVETRSASPFARSLVFAWVAAYLYEGDAPLAERRAQALTLDRHLLRELLGGEELKDLLDPAVLDEAEAELQFLAEDRRIRGVDGLHDLLRRIGDLSPDEIRARTDEAVGDQAAAFAEALTQAGRAAWLRVAGERRLVAVEDVARYRDAIGVQPPAGLPSIHLEPAKAPLESLLHRYARTHSPFGARAAARRLGLLPAQAEPALRALVTEGRLLEGEFRPSADGDRQYCDPEVLRLLRRRTLARLRQEVAPVEATVLARFLPRWHGVGSPRTGMTRLREALDQLEGVALPFSELEGEILADRVADFQPRMLDELGALGEVVWVGRGALGQGDGRVALYKRDHVAALLDAPVPPAGMSPLALAVNEYLGRRGACFFAEIVAAVSRGSDGAPLAEPPTSGEVLDAIWDLAWAGLCTNDTFQPLRALAGPRRPAARVKSGRAAAISYAAGGRWSSVSSLIAAPPPETERAYARAVMLLDRYGVVSREAAAAEGLPGGFGAVSPVLRAMEESGKVRRGYFIEGLTGMQFAHAGAVDRLRAERRPEEEDEPVVLAAVDPANPYGALLPWPAETLGDGAGVARNGDDAGGDQRPGGDDALEGGAGGARPRRVAGAKLVLVRGLPVFYLEAGGRKLRLFRSPDGGAMDGELAEAGLRALRLVAARRRHHELRIEQINGVPALESEHARLLERGGFRAEPGRLVLHAG